jgi:hypothetical protein
MTFLEVYTSLPFLVVAAGAVIYWWTGRDPKFAASSFSRRDGLLAGAVARSTSTDPVAG